MESQIQAATIVRDVKKNDYINVQTCLLVGALLFFPVALDFRNTRRVGRKRGRCLFMIGTIFLFFQGTLLQQFESNYSVLIGDGGFIETKSMIYPEPSGGQRSGKRVKMLKLMEEYEVVTTNYGWNTPASRNFTRRIISGQFFRAVISHPKYNASAWQDLEIHPDPNRKLAVFLDIDTCVEMNYPVYGKKEDWSVNAEKNHSTSGSWNSVLSSSCQFIRQAVQSPALLANPYSKLVLLDCSGKRSTHLRQVCFESFINSTKQAIIAYTSISREDASKVDIGLPPPAIKPVRLTSEERVSIKECKKRKYIFSFQGQRNYGRGQMAFLTGDDVYINLIDQEKYAKDITVGGGDSMKYTSIMKQSMFAASPRGDELFSYRFAEVLSAGAVPVVYADGWLPPFNTFNETTEQAFNWSDCAVFIPESDYKKTLDILRAIPDAKRCMMQQCALGAWDMYLSSRSGWLRGILESLPYTDIDASEKEDEEKLKHIEHRFCGSCKFNDYSSCDSRVGFLMTRYGNSKYEAVKAVLEKTSCAISHGNG
ncbi:hypothetical protein HJC23_006794 [Cyclotella cryptica]|uniref:Exostosin GT47 domain-containing protein n=1 Tax=Cyclotella cryptica TaxID=29204 RepID=A0ABD3PFR4_9STRA|eukprot:CCRYP_015143-RB/>CCRYP_015143-RB protein AED:0.01 eAED:0.01 QI:129/-1/1/1/-1/1/1/936/537